MDDFRASRNRFSSLKSHRIWRNMRAAFQIAELTLMMRATRSTSTDVWSRPNHMPSHLDAVQTTPPVDFRRFPGGLHSVAKQASFYFAFWSDFEAFGRPTCMPKFDFCAFFSMLFLIAFLHRNLIDFWKLQTWTI